MTVIEFNTIKNNNYLRWSIDYKKKKPYKKIEKWSSFPEIFL